MQTEAKLQQRAYLLHLESVQIAKGDFVNCMKHEDFGTEG